MTYIFEALAEVRLTTENIQKVIKMYPRDNDWKKLITKHRRDIDALRRGKDLPKKVEDELMAWALDNGEIKSDDVDELDDFIDSIMNEGTGVDPKVAKAVEALNKLGYMLRGRRRFHSGVKRVETFFRSGNKKLLQGAIDVLDPDIRDDVMGILEPLGFVKNGVVESVDLEEKLKVSDGLGAWITDFKDSDAPQFKDADEKKRRDMAIAAFVAAGGKLDEDTEIVKEAGYKIPKNYAQMIAKQKRNKPSLIQNKLSSAEYQKVKKLKSFNKDDWKWNGDLYIRVAEDVEFDEGKQMLKVSDMSESAMTLPQIANKYKGDIAKAQKSGNANSLKKAEKELIAWAMDNNEISNAKEAGDWLDNVVADKDQFDALLKYAKK